MAKDSNTAQRDRIYNVNFTLSSKLFILRVTIANEARGAAIFPDNMTDCTKTSCQEFDSQAELSFWLA